jgi:N-acetylmuramoyl-L-alanine amidase CwlA
MEIKQNLLTKNQFSRPGTLLKGVRGVVLHWVANPKSTAEGNRNYFENLKDQPYKTEQE